MSVDITGTWTTSGSNAATYNILQIGQLVYWLGQSSLGKGWLNVGHGTIDKEYTTFVMAWADPTGSNQGNNGVVCFSIDPDGTTITKQYGDGVGDLTKQQSSS